MAAGNWQITGNSRQEINDYLREHGFQMEEEHDHREDYNVVNEKDKTSLITTLVDRRVQKKEQPKL